MLRKLLAAVLAAACLSVCASAQGADGGLILDYIDDENGWFFKFGFLDEDGDVRIPYVYDYAEPFSCGYALVRQGSKLYFIDTNNQPAFGSDKSKYHFYTSFREGLCAVEKDGKCGYIDTNGNRVIDLVFDEAYNFSEGLAAVAVDGAYGYINNNGNVVIDYRFDEAGEFENGFAIVQKNGYCGFIDRSGAERTPFVYEDASGFSEGLAAVRLHGKYTYTDQNGALQFEPIFEEAYDFSGGIARVKLDGKYGFVRADGTYAVVPEFDALSPYYGDYAIAGRYVADGVLWYGLIDEYGNRVCPFSYDSIVYQDGCFVLTKNGQTSYLDHTLQPIAADEITTESGDIKG